MSLCDTQQTRSAPSVQRPWEDKSPRRILSQKPYRANSSLSFSGLLDRPPPGVNREIRLHSQRALSRLFCPRLLKPRLFICWAYRADWSADTVGLPLPRQWVMDGTCQDHPGCLTSYLSSSQNKYTERVQTFFFSPSVRRMQKNPRMEPGEHKLKPIHQASHRLDTDYFITHPHLPIFNMLVFIFIDILLSSTFSL